MSDEVGIGRHFGLLVETVAGSGVYEKICLMNLEKSFELSINSTTAVDPDCVDPTAPVFENSSAVSIAPVVVQGSGNFTIDRYQYVNDWVVAADQRRLRLVRTSETDAAVVECYWEGIGYPSNLGLSAPDGETATSSISVTINGNWVFNPGAPA